MKMIIKYIYLMQHILTIQKVNGLLYYAKMIPWLGKKLPDAWYASTVIKTIISIVMLIGTLLMSFALKIGYVMIMIMTPIALRGVSQPQMIVYVLWLFLLLSGFGGPLLLNGTTQPTKKEYVMISLMHMNAKRYTIARWVWELGLQTLMLGIIFVFATTDIPIWYTLIMLVYYVGMHLVGEVFHLHYYAKHDKALAGNYVWITVGMIVIYGCSYGALFLPFDVSGYETILILSMLVLGIGSMLVAVPILKKYDYTSILHKGLIANRSIYDGSLSQQTKKQGVELKDKDYSEVELREHVFATKHGYDYLNALFFRRHKRLFYRPMRRRIIGIVGVFVIFHLVLLYFGRNQIIGDWNQPFELLPAVLFLMYFTSIGERVTRAMFYNCDSSLLHFGYYKQPDVILTNFKIRLKKIILMNGLLALLMVMGYASVLCLIWTDAFVLWEHLLLMVCILSISIFFSIHHLFLYYILQPYTGELEMKSPMFGIINTIVYFACYISSQLEGSLIFACIILLVTVLYSMIAMVLVVRLAPKNFHIR